jgi:hypothetical protein
MATATGKKARSRYGNRFAAKQRRDKGSKRKKSRRTFGKLAYSNAAGNVPMGAVSANENLVARIADQRAEAGWDQDANVSVPGKTREAFDREQTVLTERKRREERLKKQQRRPSDDEDDEDDFPRGGRWEGGR